MSNEKMLLGRYRVKSKLGKGSFGRVFRAFDVIDKRDVAIKVEKVFASKNTMLRELEVHRHIDDKIEHIPKLLLYTRGATHVESEEGENKGKMYFHQYMVMELLGQSLSAIKEAAGGLIPWEPLAKMALQCISLIEKLHSQGFLHRDIKPDNFVRGLGAKHGRIYMLDFGLSRKWESLIDKYTQHDESTSSSSIVGTARYMSINVHKGCVYGWRDDLESLGYVLIYLFVGKLPWQGVQAETKRMQMNSIMRIKESSKATLCDGLPTAMLKYMEYCWALELGKTPNYGMLFDLFQQSLDQARA
jgi:serine/threonine protein kinase